jgi:single-strand DNA-binding protein
MNSVDLLVNVGTDGMEIRFTGSGYPIGNFSGASHRKWTDRNGEKRERTDWHKFVWFGKGAQNTEQYITKGRQLLIENGELRSRTYESNGKTITVVEVCVGDGTGGRVQLLGSSNGAQAVLPLAEVQDGQMGTVEIPDDEIPF